MSNLTLITLAWELHQQGMPKLRIAQRLGKHREMIHLWLQGIAAYGLLPFLERYQHAKRGPRPKRQGDLIVKPGVWTLREQEADCCGQRIAYCLEREHGVHLSVPKIYEVLREKYVLRSKGKKYHCARYGPEEQAACQAAAEAFLERYH